jgi:cytochrome c-type biogenesis protein CcmH
MPQLQANSSASAEPVSASGEKLPSIEEMVSKLAAKLEAEPEDPQGWFMLARSYMMLNRYADAAAAYKKVNMLVGDQPEILVSYADALAMVHEGQLAGKPKELIQRALELDPNLPQGLWLAGMAADQQADYETAIDYWRRLEPLLKEEPKSLQEVRQLIERAQARAGISTEKAVTASMGESPATSTSVEVDAPEVSSGKTITVNIALDPAVSQLAALEDALFIFAQALDGPPMPLAAVRKQVKDLPLKITFNDSMAMMPAMRLSNYSEVRIRARISKSGNAKPQSGDLYGELSPVAVEGQDPVHITISERIP